MLRSFQTLFMVLATLLFSASPALAWSYKEHIQFARMASSRLIDDPTTSPAMKEWLTKAVPVRLDAAGEENYFLNEKIGLDPKAYTTGILHWAWMPDWHALNDEKDVKVAPFGANERLMHFIDLEFFLTGETPRTYKPDLSGKPKLEDIPNDLADPRYVQAGYLPLRVAQIYAELVRSIREGRLHPTDAIDENNAEYFAGYLAHYLADNTQPHHATIDYKSASYFKNVRTAPNVHSAMEYLMCDDAANDYPELRREFWPMFVKQLAEYKDPIEDNTDLFRATLQVAMKSYDELPLIGAAALAAARPGVNGKAETIDVPAFFHHPGMMEMKARQTAWAVKRIERVWKQAWMEARP